jgi:hypothetical protein
MILLECDHFIVEFHHTKFSLLITCSQTDRISVRSSSDKSYWWTDWDRCTVLAEDASTHVWSGTLSSSIFIRWSYTFEMFNCEFKWWLHAINLGQINNETLIWHQREESYRIRWSFLLRFYFLLLNHLCIWNYLISFLSFERINS